MLPYFSTNQSPRVYSKPALVSTATLLHDGLDPRSRAVARSAAVQARRSPSNVANKTVYDAATRNILQIESNLRRK